MSAQIPGSLLARAYLAQNGEAAWSRGDTLQVIAWAVASHVPILGIEVWLPTTPGPTIPTPYIYTFEPKSVPGEPRNEFIVRAGREAAEYVTSFAWDTQDRAHHGMEPFFNITFGEE